MIIDCVDAIDDPFTRDTVLFSHGADDLAYALTRAMQNAFQQKMDVNSRSDIVVGG